MTEEKLKPIDPRKVFDELAQRFQYHEVWTHNEIFSLLNKWLLEKYEEAELNKSKKRSKK